MVTMVYYFKFKRVYEGKPITHSGTQKFKGTSKRFCMWCAKGHVEDMKELGWELVEQRIEEISYFSGSHWGS